MGTNLLETHRDYPDVAGRSPRGRPILRLIIYSCRYDREKNPALAESWGR